MKRIIFVVFAYSLVFSIAFSADWNMFRRNPQRTGFAYEVCNPPLIYKWSFKVGGDIVSSPSVYDGMVYFGSRDKKIYALNAFSGERVWEFMTDGWVDSSPLIWEGVVYVSSRDGFLYALNAKDGTLLWKHRTQGADVSSATMGGGFILSSSGYPKKDIFGFEIGNDNNSEPKSWVYGTKQHVYSSVAIDDNSNSAFCASNDGKVYGISIKDGINLWEKATQGGFYISTPSYQNNLVYCVPGDYDRNAYALNSITGEVVREYSVPGSGRVCISSGSLSGDKLFFVSGGTPLVLYCFELLTGRVIWSVPIGNSSGFGLSSSPAISNEVVYVGGGDGYLYAINSETGNVIEKQKIGEGKPIVSSPAIANGWVYVASTEGEITGFVGQRYVSIDGRDGERIESERTLNGRISIENLSGYKFEIGRGKNPSEWTNCIQQTTDIQTTGVSLMLNPKEFGVGEWTIRLRAEEVNPLATISTSASLVPSEVFENKIHEARLSFVITDKTYAGGATQSGNISVKEIERFISYPNPVLRGEKLFFEFLLRRDANVNVKIYNVTGRLVKTLGTEVKKGVVSRIILDTKNIASGVYFYRLDSDGFPVSAGIGKIVVVR